MHSPRGYLTQAWKMSFPPRVVVFIAPASSGSSPAIGLSGNHSDEVPQRPPETIKSPEHEATAGR